MKITIVENHMENEMDNETTGRVDCPGVPASTC